MAIILLHDKKTLHKLRINELNDLIPNKTYQEMINFLSVTVHNLAANDATDILEMAASLIVMFHRLCKEKEKKRQINNPLQMHFHRLAGQNVTHH